MAFLKGHWQLIVLTLAIFALWSTPVVVPLKLLVVFFHELSHAVMALLTGGEVESLSVNLQQGGEVWTRGGSRFLTLSAGYLGSLVVGAGLLVVALRGQADRLVLGILGGIMLVVLATYVRDIPAMLIVGATGLALLAAVWVLPTPVCDLILRVIGLSSLIYVPYDIFDDTLRRASLRSDARMLAEEVGGTTMLWGGLWLVISVVVILACLRHILGRDSNLHLPRRG